MKDQKLKKKLLGHISRSGKKQVSEKTFTKSIKFIQKSQKKFHREIVKLAILNSTSMFRVITLKNKKRRKNSVVEIPAFLRSYTHRTSWSLKYLIKTLTSKTSHNISSQLKQGIISNLVYENSAAVFKRELEKKTLTKKRYFKHYRW
jgi:ribosomal protein S7